MVMSRDVRAAFRALLRVRRRAFAGDEQMIAASAMQIRQEFEANRNVTDPVVLGDCLAKAREAVDFLSLNLVQARLNDRGNYEMSVDSSHVGQSLEEVVPKRPRKIP